MTQLEYIHLTAWMLLTGMSRTGQAYHNIYHKLAKSLVGRVWYVRESHDVAVSCMPAYGDRYLDARYVWRDHVDHGAARGDSVLFGNGTMFLESAELTDSDTYRCHVDLPDHTTELYTHSVIVFTVAEFYMEYQFVYVVPSCDHQLFDAKALQVHEFVCRQSVEKCPFHTTASCHQLTTNGREFYELSVIVQHFPASDFVVPDCDVICMKTHIVKHLADTGSEVIKALIAKEQKGQKKMFRSLRLKDNSLSGMHITTKCLSGFELYQDVICVPCFPGYFVRYTTGSLVPASAKCQPCPDDYYQDRFGMSTCYSCPGIGDQLNPNVSFSKSFCLAGYKSPMPPLYMFLIVMCSVVVVLLVMTALILTFWTRGRVWSSKQMIPAEGTA